MLFHDLNYPSPISLTRINQMSGAWCHVETLEVWLQTLADVNQLRERPHVLRACGEAAMIKNAKKIVKVVPNLHPM